MNKHMNEIPVGEDPMFMMETSHLQFEKFAQKLAQIEEENMLMKARLLEQDAAIADLSRKQVDAKVFKKEIKLLKENLVNQAELIEEIKNLKESINKKKDKTCTNKLIERRDAMRREECLANR